MHAACMFYPLSEKTMKEKGFFGWKKIYISFMHNVIRMHIIEKCDRFISFFKVWLFHVNHVCPLSGVLAQFITIGMKICFLHIFIAIHNLHSTFQLNVCTRNHSGCWIPFGFVRFVSLACFCLLISFNKKRPISQLRQNAFITNCFLWNVKCATTFLQHLDMRPCLCSRISALSLFHSSLLFCLHPPSNIMLLMTYLLFFCNRTVYL